MDALKKQSSLLGYQIAHFRESSGRAVQEAYQWIVAAHAEGAKLRIWCHKNLNKTISLADKGNIEEINSHCEKALGKFNNYMEEINNTFVQLQKLNPPLTTNQLEPFMNALKIDKEKTILAMDTLSPYLDQLTKRKSRLTTFPH